MIFKICAFAILSLISILLVKELGWRGAPLLAVSTLLGAVSLVLPTIVSAKSYFSALTGSFDISEVAQTVLKLVGLGYIVGIVADICREMGEGMIASAVSLVGRIEIIMIVAPYFFEVIKIGVSLI